VSSVANVTGGTLNVGTAATTGNAGNFDVAPTFNIGTGGQTILWA
jgi:hypothetical protein